MVDDTHSDEELVAFFKALSNRNRRAIIRHLETHGIASVADPAKAIGLTTGGTRTHLKKLSEAKLVVGSSAGNLTLYRLPREPPTFVEENLKLLCPC